MSTGQFDRFAGLFHEQDAAIPLDEACALIGTQLDMGIDPDLQLRRLDELAEGFSGRSIGDLCGHLFDGLGFAGDTESYASPDNSLLHRVLDRRLGVPISLAVIVIEVGRRAEVPVVGIGMPGHFLLRDARTPDRFVDPFSGGIELDGEGCRRIFHQLHGDHVPFEPDYLDPAPASAIVRRILANLRNSYGRLRDRSHLVEVMRMRTVVDDGSSTEFEELALGLEHTGQFGHAADALESAAARSGDTERGLLLRRAQHLRARLN